MSKTNLLGLTKHELKSITEELNMPSFTATQIATWLYSKRATSVNEMTDISKLNRAKLNERYFVGRDAPIERLVSSDGTIKYLFRAGEGAFVESVYIPDNDRATLCVSSQIGCKMGCKFCMTGRQGFHGNLSAGMILNQIFSIPEAGKLTNVVYMGMGEPMDNVDEVLKSLEILTAPYGVAWSPRRITVSTVGVEMGLKQLLDKSECHVAISLHSAIPAQRASMMPAERAWPIEEVLDLLRPYDFSKQRRLSFEYIMFAGVNDSEMHAKKVVKLLRGIDCRVNLIRFHAIPNTDLEGSDMERMLAFRDYLTTHGVFCTIRASRGEDIFAACGMLSTKEKEKTGNI